MANEGDKKNQGEQQAKNPQDQPIVSPTDGKFEISPITIFVFIFLAEAGIICWMLAEHFSPRFPKAADALLLLGIFILGAVGIHNVVKSVEFQKNYARFSRWVWVIYIFSCCVLAGVFAITLPTKADAQNAPIVIAVPRPDYIEGTQVTSKQLDDFFPFGYAVIYLNESGEKRIHEVHNKLLEWKWNWSEVKIEPDVSAGNVTWTLPQNLLATGQNIELEFKNTTVQGTTRFTKEIVRARGAFFPGKPCPFVGILSTNQRQPVFVIGFRIPQSENEIFYPP